MDVVGIACWEVSGRRCSLNLVNSKVSGAKDLVEAEVVVQMSSGDTSCAYTLLDDSSIRRVVQEFWRSILGGV